MVKNLYEVIIFDLDDTLYSEKDFVMSGFHAVSDFLSKKYKLDKEEIFETLRDDFNKGIRKRNFNILLEKLKIKNQKITELIDIYRYHNPQIFLSSEDERVLEILKRNYRLCLLTDGLKKCQKNKISALKIENFFDKIIINDPHSNIDKTSEKPFYDIINYFNTSPQKFVFVADNPLKDFIIPTKLKMYTIRIYRKDGLYISLKNQENFKPKKEIKSLKELLNILTLRSTTNEERL